MRGRNGPEIGGRETVVNKDANKIATNLLRWYDKAKRDLPWRQTRDPYKIWVSEVMLQQTTVSVVQKRYGQFVERFPDLETLAASTEEEVLAEWSGLGYYSRARSFLRAARMVVAEHGGEVPPRAAEFGALPGVGAYTTGAVLSIAFDLPEPIVDGNVIRVLCRLFALRGDPAGGPLKKKLWALAKELQSPRRPGDFNQALMELGALVCTPRKPLCVHCPVRGVCQALARGLIDRFPQAKKRQKLQSITLAALLIKRGGRILLMRQPPDARLLRDMWLFPLVEVDSLTEAPRRLSQLATRILGVPVESGDTPLETIPHSITCYRIRFSLFPSRIEQKPATLRSASHLRWVRPREIDTLPVSSLVQKALSRCCG